MEPRPPDTRAGKGNPPGTPAPDGGITTVPYQPPLEAATHADATTHYPTPVTRELPGALPVIKNYELVREIKGGGMGIVYEARHKDSGRTEALKTIRQELAAGEHLDRFTREVQTVARLNHPNIVRIYHVGLDESRPYYTMEYLAGGSLLDQRARFKGHPAKAAELMEKIARAVHHAHEQGIYHRDLKPGNVLMKEDGEPIVTDFGLAKLREADVQLTRTGAALGTPAYMSPEQFQGRTDVGAPTDIWALGVMLYELLAGKRPFEGDSTAEVQQKVINATPLGVRQHNAIIDPVLERIVSKCLVKEPEWRFRSAGELAEHLTRWREGDPIPLGRESAARKARRWIRRHPRVTALCTVIILAVAGAAAARIYLDPSRALLNAYARLRAGQPATLIGRRGPPLWMQWITPPHPIDVFGEEKDPGYAMSTANIDLLELLPTPGLDAYCLRAEVRHAGGVGSDSEVGLYFARQSNKHVHFLWVYAFNDIPFIGADGQPCNTMRFGLRGIGHDGRSATPHREAAAMKFVAAGANKKWRRLVMKVDADTVSLYWDGQLFSQKSRNELQAESVPLLQLMPQMFEELSSEVLGNAGLGLYANRSTVDFRNVVIEPLLK
jgi:serine/threonine-protein kinase